MTFMDPQPSREYAALAAGQELAAYAFIRAWMADDVDKGMLLIEQHHVPKEAALSVPGDSRRGEPLGYLDRPVPPVNRERPTWIGRRPASLSADRS